MGTANWYGARNALLTNYADIKQASVITGSVHREKGKTMEWIVEAESFTALCTNEWTLGKELVRCKDCKHWGIHKRLNIPWCREAHIDRGAEDFCSMAERKDDE